MEQSLESLYREEIINHYKYPHNWGKIDDADVVVYSHNPLCGDNLFLFLKLEDEKIKEIKFYGESCSISQASASMLSDYLIGKTVKEIKDIKPDFIFDLLKIDISQSRVKCALLPLETISKLNYPRFPPRESGILLDGL